MTQLQAMLLALTAFTGWVFMDVAIKLASQSAVPPSIIMAFLGVTGVVGTVAIAAYKRNLSLLMPKNWREQSIISLCSIGINYAIVIALKHLSLTLFYIVVFTAPLVIAGLSAFLQHEVLTRAKIACLVAGFVGVVIAVGPHMGSKGEWIGCAAALAAVASFAVYTVTIRKIAQTDTPESIQLFNAMAVGGAGLIGGLGLAYPSGWSFAMLLGAGAINLAGNFLYNLALGHTSSTNVAQIHYTQIISGALFGYVIWHEVPTWNLWLGSVIIVASGVIVAMQAPKPEPAILP